VNHAGCFSALYGDLPVQNISLGVAASALSASAFLIRFTSNVKVKILWPRNSSPLLWILPLGNPPG
jgi:hypothetical protein